MVDRTHPRHSRSYSRSSRFSNLIVMAQIFTARLSQFFTLEEFCNMTKYPQNVPSMQQVINMAYGCIKILDSARCVVGPIIINSGFRCKEVNKLVGGVENSQHLLGQAADIRPSNPARFKLLVEYLETNPNVDQLLTASNWLHVSWSPFIKPRRMVRIGYYK